MNSRRLNGLIGLALVTATLAVYGSVPRFQFVKFDDDLYVYNNPHVTAGLTGEGIRWAFAADFSADSPNADFWIPLTFISHMAVAELFGMDPAGHHVVNLVFHVLNTLLLFLVLRKMTGAVWSSAFVAGLFALHPLHVESVAWVTERKDVLSTFFMMLAFLAYASYREKPGAGRYTLIAVFFALGLMSKPMLVTLPVLLLLLDFWPYRRFEGADFKTFEGRRVFGRVVLEKIPLFGLSVFSSAVTFLAVQREGVVHALADLPLWTRIGNALVSYSSYIGKTLWPVHLAPFYPYDPASLSTVSAAGSGLLLLFITGAVWRSASTRPYLLFGWLWFLVSLVPVIGIVQAGTQSMADRYTYIPLIGLFIMAAWGVREAVNRWKPAGNFLIVASAAILFSLGLLAKVQAGHWRNSEALFRHSLRVTVDNEQAYHGMGIERLEQGRLDEAIGFFLEAVRIDPGFERAHINLGNAYLQKRSAGEALTHYQHALLLNPDNEVVYNNLGLASYYGGRKDEALGYFNEALHRNPAYSDSYTNIGIVLFRAGNPEEALEYFQRALKINPGDGVARDYLEKISFSRDR